MCSFVRLIYARALYRCMSQSVAVPGSRDLWSEQIDVIDKKDNFTISSGPQEERSENRTVSTVDFEPGVEDHGKSITCRAENPNVTGLYVEKSWKIDVVCEYTLHFSLTFQFLADRKLAHDWQIAKLIAVNRIRQHDE